MKDVPGGDDHRAWLEARLDHDFTVEGAIVEARLDPILVGLANELFASGHPLTGFAISTLVLDRCRRTLTGMFDQEQFDTAAAAVLAETFERVGRDVVLRTARKLATDEDLGIDNVFGRLVREAARNSFRRGKWWGFKLGVLTGIPIALAGVVVLSLILP